jgi:hypothetical protein
MHGLLLLLGNIQILTIVLQVYFFSEARRGFCGSVFRSPGLDSDSYRSAEPDLGGPTLIGTKKKKLVLELGPVS